jgi:hypothetical protein
VTLAFSEKLYCVSTLDGGLSTQMPEGGKIDARDLHYMKSKFQEWLTRETWPSQLLIPVCVNLSAF